MARWYSLINPIRPEIEMQKQTRLKPLNYISRKRHLINQPLIFLNKEMGIEGL